MEWLAYSGFFVIGYVVGYRRALQHFKNKFMIWHIQQQRLKAKEKTDAE